jgi:F0F1-type ATP synthase membrane subunit b/b'
VQTAKVQAGKEKAVATERVEEEVDWVWEREEKDMKNQLNELIEEINLVVDSFRVELQDLASSPDDGDDEARQ